NHPAIHLYATGILPTCETENPCLDFRNTFTAPLFAPVSAAQTITSKSSYGNGIGNKMLV
ncbi:hypothetical protein P2R67_25805, partial [Escherichia coli]